VGHPDYPAVGDECNRDSFRVRLSIGTGRKDFHLLFRVRHRFPLFDGHLRQL